jgi:hypothetical protein
MSTSEFDHVDLLSHDLLVYNIIYPEDGVNMFVQHVIYQTTQHHTPEESNVYHLTA